MKSILPFLLFTCAYIILLENNSIAQIPNYTPNIVTVNGANNFPGGNAPVFTVTPPTTTTGTGSIKIVWSAGSTAASIRGIVLHGGLKFDGTTEPGNSQILNNGNAFTYTFANLSAGVYSFATRSDINDDKLQTNSAASDKNDDVTFGGSATSTSDHQMSGIYTVVLLPSGTAGNGNLSSLTASVPTLATSCLNNDGVIRLSGLENITYEISISAFPNYLISATAVGGIININSRYPGIYPVRIRKAGTNVFRLINVEVPVVGGIACYKNDVTCAYNMGPNLIANSNFGASSSSGILPGTTTYWNASWADGSNLPGDRRYAVTKSSLNADKGITQNNNGLLRAFDYTGRNTHLWGAIQSSKDHTGSTTGADGTTNGYYMFINGNYEQDVAIAVPNINLDRCKIYEFSAWVKNMQPYFPQNKNNGTTLVATYQPIIPRLGFVVAGVIYNFTDLTANLQPADIKTRTLINDAQWKKIGVRFRVPFDMPAQEIGIYNFQNGGFGNDFAIDDIYFGEITSQYQLTGQANGVCNTPGLVVVMNANNACVPPGAPTYRWQLSTNNGTAWTNQGTQFTSLPNNYTAPSTTTSSWYRLQITEGVCTTYSGAVPFTQQGAICILPSLDITLNGNQSDGHNVIKWQTKNDADVLEYHLQKSTNGTVFSLITSKQNNLSGTFEYRDYNSSVISYYRVAIKYNDGTTKYSTILKINNHKTAKNFEFSTFPNPITDYVNISIQTPEEGNCQIRITDLQGHILKQTQSGLQKGFNSVAISDFSKFSSGIYLMEMEQNGVKKYSKILVK